MHSILNRVIQAINPATIPHEPHALFSTFKDSLRDGAIGELLLFSQLQFIYNILLEFKNYFWIK